MKFEGRVYRDGKWWLAEVGSLDAMTQGRTRAEALEMIADWVRSMLDRPEMEVTVSAAPRAEKFELSSPDVGALVALMLRRQREAAGLSLRDVSARLGERSPNAYARYESGKTMPTLPKLTELLAAVRPGADVVLNVSQILDGPA